MIDPRPQLLELESRAQRREVHPLRVQALRLNVWLELAGYRVLRPDLRWLRLQARAQRDLEVLLQGGWVSVSSAELELARAQLERALHSPRYRGLLRALAALPALDPNRAERSLARLCTRARRAAGAALLASEDPELRHRLRRRARRLRYALEWLGHSARALIELQDELGRSNDAAVALERALQDPAAQPRQIEHLRKQAAGDKQRLKQLWSAVEQELEEAE